MRRKIQKLEDMFKNLENVVINLDKTMANKLESGMHLDKEVQKALEAFASA